MRKRHSESRYSRKSTRSCHSSYRSRSSSTPRILGKPTLSVLGGIIVLITLVLSGCGLFRKPASNLTPNTPSPPNITTTDSPTLLPYQILYLVTNVVTHSFAEAEQAKAHDLLTELGVPTAEQQVDIGDTGVLPADTLPLLGLLNDLAGAVYDPDTKRVLFLGTVNPALPPIDQNDFLACYAVCLFEPR